MTSQTGAGTSRTGSRAAAGARHCGCRCWAPRRHRLWLGGHMGHGPQADAGTGGVGVRARARCTARPRGGHGRRYGRLRLCGCRNLQPRARTQILSWRGPSRLTRVLWRCFNSRRCSFQVSLWPHDLLLALDPLAMTNSNEEVRDARVRTRSAVVWVYARSRPLFLRVRGCHELRAPARHLGVAAARHSGAKELAVVGARGLGVSARALDARGQRRGGRAAPLVRPLTAPCVTANSHMFAKTGTDLALLLAFRHRAGCSPQSWCASGNPSGRSSSWGRAAPRSVGSMLRYSRCRPPARPGVPGARPSDHPTDARRCPPDLPPC